MLNKIPSSNYNDNTYTVDFSKNLFKTILRFLNNYRLLVSLPIFIIKVFSHLNLILIGLYFYLDQKLKLICKKPTDISLIEKDLSFKPSSIRKFIKESEDEAFF